MAEKNLSKFHLEQNPDKSWYVTASTCDVEKINWTSHGFFASKILSAITETGISER